MFPRKRRNKMERSEAGADEQPSAVMFPTLDRDICAAIVLSVRPFAV